MDREYYPLINDPQLELCLTGKCDCASASKCKFKRCKNCDLPVDDTGKTITDWCGYGEVYEERICPDCSAVMSKS